MNSAYVIELDRASNEEKVLRSDHAHISRQRIERLARPFERDVIAAFNWLGRDKRRDTFTLIMCLPVTEVRAEDGTQWTPAYDQTRFDVAEGDLLFVNTASIWLRWGRVNPLEPHGSRQELEYKLMLRTTFRNLFVVYHGEGLAEAKEEIRIHELARHLFHNIQNAMKESISSLDRRAADLREQADLIARERRELLQFINPFSS